MTRWNENLHLHCPLGRSARSGQGLGWAKGPAWRWQVPWVRCFRNPGKCGRMRALGPVGRAHVHSCTKFRASNN